MPAGSKFAFADPLWLLLLLPATLLLVLRRGRGADSAVVFPTLSVLAGLGSTVRRRPWHFALPLVFLALVPAIIALARPVLRRDSPDRTPSGIDIVIALDVSLSMDIDDFRRPGNRFDGLRRIDAAKAVVEAFIERRVDDRIGLVAFSGRPYSVSPITLDHKWVINGLRRLRLGDLEEQGTAIGSAVAAAATRLDARDSKSKIVVLVTDGSNNSGKLDPVEAAELASRLGVRVYTVAIGTEEGRVSRGIQRFPRQEFDVETLRRIASITGAEFYRARDIGSLQSTFATIDRLETSSAEAGRTIEQTELFPWFAGAAAIASLAAALAYALNPPPGR
jgi:Ca-activated chloride channel family protein